MTKLKAIEYYANIACLLFAQLFFECVAADREKNVKPNFSELWPLEIAKKADFEVTKNVVSLKHKQEWYSIVDKSIKSNDDKEYIIGVVKYLDKQYALNEFNTLVSEGNLTLS